MQPSSGFTMPLSCILVLFCSLAEISNFHRGRKQKRSSNAMALVDPSNPGRSLDHRFVQKHLSLSLSLDVS